MRRRSQCGGVVSVGLVTLLLSACVPAEAEVVGRWESTDSAVVVFSDDGTFAATGLGVHVLLPVGVEGEDVPDELAGTWYVESPFEDVCDPGETIKISWRTEPVLYADAFCLVGRGPDAIALPTHQDDGSPTYLDFVRTSDTRMPPRWYLGAMEITMDKSGRIVVPKDLRDALGMEEGGTFDISRYGSGLHLEPHGRKARIVERDGRLVLTSEHVVTDEEMYALIDALRR